MHSSLRKVGQLDRHRYMATSEMIDYRHARHLEYFRVSVHRGESLHANNFEGEPHVRVTTLRIRCIHFI